MRWEDRHRSRVRVGLSDDAARALATDVLGWLREEPELLTRLRAYLGDLGRSRLPGHG